MLTEDNKQDKLFGGSTDQVGGGAAVILKRRWKIMDLTLQSMET